MAASLNDFALMLMVAHWYSASPCSPHTHLHCYMPRLGCNTHICTESWPRQSRCRVLVVTHTFALCECVAFLLEFTELAEPVEMPCLRRNTRVLPAAEPICDRGFVTGINTRNAEVCCNPNRDYCTPDGTRAFLHLAPIGDDRKSEDIFTLSAISCSGYVSICCNACASKCMQRVARPRLHDYLPLAKLYRCYGTSSELSREHRARLML